MPLTTVICTFAGFCGLNGCGEQSGDHSVKARFDPEYLIAEFWTSADIADDPWPAVLQSTGFGREVWVLFSASSIQGHWMLTVVPSTGEGLLTHQYVHFGSDIRSAKGTCDIAKEDAL